MLTYKCSKYNFFHKVGNSYLVYNQMSRALMEVDEELFNTLSEKNINKIPESVKEQLVSDGYICSTKFTEENYFLFKNHICRYSQDTIRITIMPTLSCNFSCWYCYENHIPGSMSDDAKKAILLFCKKIIKSKKYRHFHLDWFGGEPLLYFKKIVYPISLEIKNLCAEYDMYFHNSITTNGYMISNDVIDDIKEIQLNSYQITFDGCQEDHNKVRFMPNDHDSYTRLKDNIILLCRNIEKIDMSLRINYTPDNVGKIDLIADDFPEDVRSKILVQPQLVWQYKSGINPQNGKISDKTKVFKDKGFIIKSNNFNCNFCYAESMSQFVINYDLNVYKCTARDFINKDNSVGIINMEGDFVPSPHFYDYCVPSYMECKECLACDLLPSCLGLCIQKRIEGCKDCYKEQVEGDLRHKLNTFMEEHSV